MKLRLGQPVDTTDGHFGVLGDIIVDPQARTVTHVVVQPKHQHFQARLVPIWLVTEESGTLTVDLDTAHLRQLEAVAESQYMQLDEPVDLGPRWDVGTEDVSMMPYQTIDLDLEVFGNDFVVSYDRIPKGECEIRRTSDVVTGDEIVGQVDGFVAEDEHLTAVVVRVGLPGFRHHVLVPFGAVGRVRNDRIALTMTEDEFHRLPRTEVWGEPDELNAHITDLRRRAESIGAKLADQSRRLVAFAKDRFGSGPS